MKLYEVKDQNVYVRASIGISFYSEDGTTPEDVISSADTAMYNAKDAGR